MSAANILVVDDERFFRELYQQLLEEAGYQVEVCADGDAAVERMTRGGFDLVLTDMVMPGLDGLGVLKAARALPNPPEVILITGHASLDSAIESLKNGARDYLIKPFDESELRHLVKTCLDQRRLLDENQQLKTQIRLFQSGQALSSLIDIELLLPQALERLQRELGGGKGFGFLLNQGGATRFHGLLGIESEQARDIPELLYDIFQQQESFHLLQERERELLADTVVRSDAVGLLPLKVDGELRGGVLLYDAPALASQATIPVDSLHYLTEQIAIGFDNACRYQSAQDLMHTDDLTGLYNHRYLQIALDHEVRRSERYGLQFSLLFLDLDHFKSINDRYGHLSGSAALKEVGELLRRCVREVDTLFRFGGDEFAAILVDADANTSRVIAERVRQAIEEHVFLEEQQTPSRLTVTAGYATYPTDAEDQEKLLDLADQAMYDGKLVRNVIRGVLELNKD